MAGLCACARAGVGDVVTPAEVVDDPGTGGYATP